MLRAAAAEDDCHPHLASGHGRHPSGVVGAARAGPSPPFGSVRPVWTAPPRVPSPAAEERPAPTAPSPPSPPGLPPRWWLPAAVAVGAALALWRGWHRVAEPAFWGEDGSVFVPEAREDGPPAVLRTYAGFLHLLPRLVAVALRPFPLSWQPGLYAAAGLALGFAICCLALSARLDPLLPHWWQRALLFGALLVAPGRDEVTGNVANLIFLGPVGLLLLGLCRDPARRAGRRAELAGAALLSLGGVLALMVAPVFLARAARTRSRHSAVLAGVVAAGGAVQLALLLTNPRVDDRAGSPAVVVSFLQHRLLPAWLVGDHGFEGAWQTHPVPLALGCVALAVLLGLAVLAVPSRPAGLALAATALLAATAAGLTYPRLWYLPIAQRHLVLPLTVLTVLVVCALAAPRAAVRLAAGAALLASLLAVRADWALTRWPELPVGPTAACLAAGRAPCPLPVNATPRPVHLDR